MIRRLETSVHWILIGLTVVMMAAATREAWNRIGQPSPGFAVMENMLVGVGGVDRVGLQPFDVVRAVNGRLVTSTRDLQAEIERPLEDLGSLSLRNVEAPVRTYRLTTADAVPTAPIG